MKIIDYEMFDGKCHWEKIYNKPNKNFMLESFTEYHHRLFVSNAKTFINVYDITIEPTASISFKKHFAL